MFYDFQLSENGDILFKQSNRSKEFLQFDFYVAKTNGLVFDFYIDNPDNDKEIVYIDDKEEYLYQQIKIRLSSALGTIRGNENLGSTLDNYRHMLLNPDKKKEYTDLIICVRNAINDILPDAQIDIYNTPTIYTDFTNSIVIAITQEDLNFYYYL